MSQMNSRVIMKSEKRIKPSRRIQTACVKKPEHTQHETVVEEDYGGWMITKPRTANKRTQNEARRLFSRNKSRSKPTTATTHTKCSQYL